MSYNYTVLKNNLTKIMNERSLRIVDIEAKANKGRIVNNILRGTSTNPTIDTIKAIAEALNIDINDLLNDRSSNEKLKYNLLVDVFSKVLNEISSVVDKYNVTFDDALNLVKEAYNYSNDLNLSQADEQFIKWIVKQKYNF